MDKQNDLFLINKVKEGDTQAFSSLVKRYETRVISLVWKIVKNKEDAEDIGQEIFVKAFQNLSRFKGEAKFSTWLYQISYNTAVSYYRKKEIEITTDIFYTNDETIAETQNSLNKMIAEERANILNKAITNLDAQESALIDLYYREECSVEEIAEITGLSNSNVKVSLFRVRKKLYGILNKQLNP